MIYLSLRFRVKHKMRIAFVVTQILKYVPTWVYGRKYIMHFATMYMVSNMFGPTTFIEA